MQSRYCIFGNEIRESSSSTHMAHYAQDGLCVVTFLNHQVNRTVLLGRRGFHERFSLSYAQLDSYQH